VHLPARANAQSPAFDLVTVVRHAFAALAGRDLDTVLKLCDPDVVPRPQHTSAAELTGRQDPYSGCDGMRAYARDISQVWKSLELTPTAFRAADHSVIVSAEPTPDQKTETNTVYVLWV
jgi:ketosteroid isomerase-like protein